MEEKNLELKPKMIRESEFFGGCIRVKISVKNTSSLAIMDAALELDSDERILHFDRCEPEYPEKKGKIILGNINPNSDRTIAFYLDPLICAKEGTDINCRVFYKDAYGRSDMVQMEPLKIKVVCPIFRTEQDINIGRLKELVSGLSFHDSKVYTIPKRVEQAELLGTCRDVVQLHDVRHIKTFKTTDEKTYEAWYYGKTKVTKKDLVIKCCLRRDTESIEVFAAGDDPGDITGLLAEIGRNLAKEFERLGKVQPVFNITIKDSIIQRSNLLSFCDLDGTCGGDVVIEDSVMQRANIGLGNETRFLEEEEQRREKQEKYEAFQLKQKKEEEERKASEDRGNRERKAEAERRDREKQKAIQEEERQIRQREEAAIIKKEKEDKHARIEPGEKSSGGKWFNGVIIIFGVLALGWFVTQGSNSPQVSVNPAPAATPSAAAVVTSSADQKTIINSIGMEFVLIPAGEFDMGSPSNEKDRLNDEGPVHHVKISNTFYMGKYEVTQKQWRDVMGTSPSPFDDQPVERVSWNDVQDFIKKFNEKEGLNKYRLPSEAEWEYAARAGTTTRFSFGDDESKLGDYAWYYDNSNNKTHNVGQKKPNPWGLYDMHGNVGEWVQNIYQSDYSGAPTDGNAWEGSGITRVFRGGWHNFEGRCRSASRLYVLPDSYRGSTLGFRLVRNV
ncbi:MAG: formylglycine-generating enzyme family protein [Candidatus Methanoperedenaceae archaeon]|nr:formylglycine-generating enzyme family protein [Candidatus Methanoperedenaceae archaeon]